MDFSAEAFVLNVFSFTSADLKDENCSHIQQKWDKITLRVFSGFDIKTIWRAQLIIETQERFDKISTKPFSLAWDKTIFRLQNHIFHQTHRKIASNVTRWTLRIFWSSNSSHSSKQKMLNDTIEVCSYWNEKIFLYKTFPRQRSMNAASNCFFYSCYCGGWNFKTK